MDKGAEKVSIFDTLKGPHDRRFVAFKDISDTNSKYSKQPMLVHKALTTGREVALMHPFGAPPVPDDRASLDPNHEFILKRLNRGYVEFGQFEGRKDTDEKNEPQNFYHTIDVEDKIENYRPKMVKPPVWEVMGNKRRTDTC